MMAMLWAQQIMLGKKTYAQVPRLLKEQVKEILIDSGCENLVTEQLGKGYDSLLKKLNAQKMTILRIERGYLLCKKL